MANVELYKKLLLGNKSWSKEKTDLDNAYFLNLAKSQQPDFLWIGCSDSRVPIETITGARPGEIFVHRNIANLICPDDINVLSVIEYAVHILKVRHVVVCGHYGCGGARAALDDQSLGLLDDWIGRIKCTHESHREEVDKFPNTEDRINSLVEFNVRAQVENLVATKSIQRAWEEYNAPSIHGWVFNLKTGLIEELVTIKPEGFS